MFRSAYLLLMICTIARGFQQGTNSGDSEREKDVYTIYSLMLANPQRSHGPDENPRYLIAAATGPGYPQEPCVRPPKEREADFREVLVDYERRKSNPRELKPSLVVPKPYVLLAANQVSEFVKERSLPSITKTVPNALFQGVTDVFTLSEVYFNQRERWH